ncbi:hypothetical protein Dtox_4082 [Desulfofarcimen acetoxidans DSM 771]|uniref:Uncharacterized protein n=1 Tax=Desulfofarcimen acetoxidans (strain ATCC 49208 / DSM 771 / KCTC 5769 / VKM B-1644 / 5575) TaxID=485916 RepID=C8VYN5_DESAS|nr:hypothetical protein Dtox_4082 [Desulfofarcimen acetoxidans DSM 771]
MEIRLVPGPWSLQPRDLQEFLYNTLIYLLTKGRGPSPALTFLNRRIFNK